jgi:hypothetical protein
MNSRIIHSAVLVAAIFFAGCGGGGQSNSGGPSDGSQTPAPRAAPAAGPDEMVAKSWKVDQLNLDGAVLDPFTTAPSTPRIDFLRGDGTNCSVVGVEYVSDSGWQQRGTRLEGIPKENCSTGVQVARSGDWVVATFTHRGSSGDDEIWARVTGPGSDSGLTLLGTTDTSHATLVSIDGNGRAVIVWAERHGLASRRFDGREFTPVTTITGLTDVNLITHTSTSDGSGWLFYQTRGDPATDSNVHIWARPFDVNGGVGSAVALDAPDQGWPQSWSVVVKTEGNGKFTTLWLQKRASGSCLATRRYDGSSWSSATCVHETAPGGDNEIASYGLGGNGNGTMLAVWLDRAGMHVYSATRKGDTAWDAPVVAAHVSAPYRFARRARPYVSSTGHRMIVYQLNHELGNVAHAVTASPGENWETPIALHAPDGASAELAVGGFDIHGLPAVAWISASSESDAILFRRKRPQGWEPTQTIQGNVKIATPVIGGNRYWSYTLLRLVPTNDGNWVAFWQQNNAGNWSIYGGRLD